MVDLEIPRVQRSRIKEKVIHNLCQKMMLQIKHIFSGKEGHPEDPPYRAESYLLIWQIIKKNLLVLINTEIHGMLK